ncbi:hypothetical protein [Candidatus Enterovibrio escicola]|uniref:hypothetical protein n=1 Tax=Candidatus Enterovibrio escicola TaxID=1927127 RepID=UPI001CC2A0AD|nr:hypothetical protein [Candidatus Enterovibrio escacola]
MAKSGDVQDEQSDFMLLQSRSTCVHTGNVVLPWQKIVPDIFLVPTSKQALAKNAM